MQKLIIATMLAGLSCVFVGCNEGNTPAPKLTDSLEPISPKPDAPSKIVSESDTLPKVDLEEPEMTDEPEPAGELIVGDPAPPISIAKWVQGEPVSKFSKDKIYVVEFWATWCGPCLKSMPHIAALQAEYGDKATFIGVTAEDDEEVSDFMGQTAHGGKKWSEVLTYRIALDQRRQTNAAYMDAAGQDGIPCAFIVGKTGNVEWIGHPMEIDDPLKQIVEGTWDAESARATSLAQREAALAERKSEEEAQKTAVQINEALQNDDFKTVVTLIEKLIDQFPDNGAFKKARIEYLLKGQMFEEANKSAAALIEAAKDNELELDHLAWILATSVTGPGPDLDLAMSAVNRAEELTESKNSSVLDTMGHVLFAQGKIEEAILAEKKAIEISSPDEKKKYEANIKKFEAAAAEGKTSEEPPTSADSSPSETPDAGK